MNLLSDLGTKGYFEPGFASVDYTSATDLFYGGTGGIFYSGSGQINLAEDMYDAGQIGFFPVPDTEEMDNRRQIFQSMQDLVLDIIRLHGMILMKCLQPFTKHILTRLFILHRIIC